jgi:hypothetical protein
LTDGQIADLLEEINQEMIGGRNMFNYLIDETLKKSTPKDLRDLR